jgi:hypothetical protein
MRSRICACKALVSWYSGHRIARPQDLPDLRTTAVARTPATAEVVPDGTVEALMDALVSIVLLAAAMGMAVSIGMLSIAAIGALLTRR